MMENTRDMQANSTDFIPRVFSLQPIIISTSLGSSPSTSVNRSRFRGSLHSEFTLSCNRNRRFGTGYIVLDVRGVSDFQRLWIFISFPSKLNIRAAEEKEPLNALFSQDFMVKQYTGEKSELNTEISLLPYNFSSATVTIKD